MDKLKSPLFLWILLVVILVLMVPVVIIDRASHPSTVTKTTGTTAGENADAVKTGWKVGEMAPDFVLTTIENRDIKLSDYRGKIILLNFWATWCGPCKLEIPVLKSMHDRLEKEGTVILAVNTQDSFENALSFASNNKLNFTVPVDPRGIVAKSYNVHGIPTTFFIDEKGVISSIKIGPFLSEQEITDRISYKNQ